MGSVSEFRDKLVELLLQGLLVHTDTAMLSRMILATTSTNRRRVTEELLLDNTQFFFPTDGSKLSPTAWLPTQASWPK